MAAEAIVTESAKGILGNLLTLVTDQIGLAWGFEDELKRLRENVEMVQALLADAEKRQVKEESVRLWLQRLKDVAYDADDVLDEHAYELLRRKVEIQNQRKRKDVERDDYDNVKSCKMHDLVHDLVLSISKIETLVLEEDSQDNNNHVQDDINHVRRLLIQYDGEIVPKIPLSNDHVRRMRTLVSKNAMSVNILSDFKCLRVLKLSGNQITELSDSIGYLVHLRLLHISNASIKALPNSITKLYNLQTLRLEGCYYLKELPKDLKKLDNLRHIYIYINDYDEIKRAPKDMGNLNCLQTLSCFIVGQDAGEQIEELGCLNQLSGELDITHLENVRDQEEARSANLAIKAKMNQLRFHWSLYENRKVNHCNDEEVLEGLRPHQNLKSIKISGFLGKKFPSWMSLFDNLIQIILYRCYKCEQVPTLGHLPRLKALEILAMDEVTCIGVEFYGSSNNVLFPKLRTLKFWCMKKLVEWKDAPPARVVFPCLEKLTIQYCEQLRSAPICHFPSLQKLTIFAVYNNTALEKISSNLTTLKSAHIICASGLTFVPEQLFCTTLQSLAIEDCKDLSYIPDTSQPLIFLEELKIRCCPKLKCFPRVQGLRRLSIKECGFEDLTKLQLCTSLSQLHVEGCPALKSLPVLQGCRSLAQLKIHRCHNLESLPDLQECHSLAQLDIYGCHYLTSIPDLQECHSLAQLVIYWCDNLKSIPHLGELCFLTRLQIEGCSNITCLPEGSLKCLKSLEIGGYCEELDVFPSLNFIQHSYTTLEILHLIGWAKLNSLPAEIQHFTALETLVIFRFDGIETLPEWLGNLSSLKELTISSCSKLEERYAERSGAEWLKIAHIPNIHIY